MTPKEELYNEIKVFFEGPPQGLLKYPSVAAEVLMEMINPYLEDARREGEVDYAHRLGQEP